MSGYEQTLDDESLMEDHTEDQPTELPKYVSPEYNNLAESLDANELKEIAAKVIKDFDDDLESRAPWEEKHAKWLKLFHQEDQSVNPPWDGSSEESIPILAEAVYQFQSRSYKAFFPNRYFVDAIPVGKPSRQARERAERVGKHISYQLGVLDRTYKPNKNEMFLASALHGSDFTKTYFSPIKRRTIIERVRAMDLVVPYGTGPRKIKDIERKTQIKFMSLNETKVLAQTGWFLSECEPWDESKNPTLPQQAVDQSEGIQAPPMTNSNESECCVLEQHCLLDLDEDGIGEPYIVWIDRQSQDVKRIQIRYEVDEMGLPIDNKEPIEYFTHYQFLPNPDGFYGLGFGHLLGHMNKALNKLIRMFIDGNELHVIGNTTGYISENLGLQGDTNEISMGRMNKIPRSVEDIRKHVMFMQFEPPSAQTLQSIELLQGHADRLSTNTDILAGQPDKVYQPTAMLAMIEQGLQLFSSVQEFLGFSMEDELEKVYRLNAKYLEEDQYYQWGDDQIQVTREDYQDDFRIVPIFDPKYSTRSQKLAKSQAVYEFILQNPLTMQDGESIYLASKDYLEALDAEDIDLILKKPANQQPVRIEDQNLENTYFLMPPEKRPLFDVFPDQDHINHIQMIDKFIAWLDQSQPLLVPNLPGGDPGISNLLTTMSDEQKQELVANLIRHRTLHMAYMFGQMNGVINQQGQPNETGPTGTEPMAQEGNDDQGVEGLMQLLRSSGMDELQSGQGGIPQGAGGDDATLAASLR